MSPPSISETINQLVRYAIDQIGHCYHYGGAPGKFGLGCWDCSSFCNWLWGFIARQSIPGFPAGTYDGTVHGPSTLGWLSWQGQGVGSVHRSLASAGDLAVWPSHMGFCIDSNEMVSAQDPQKGTRKSGIDGFIGGQQPIILRLAVVGPGGITLPFPEPGSTARIDHVIRDIAQSDRDFTWTRMRLRRVPIPKAR